MGTISKILAYELDLITAAALEGEVLSVIHMLITGLLAPELPQIL